MSTMTEAISAVMDKKLERQTNADCCYGTVKRESPLLIVLDSNLQLDVGMGTLSVCQHLTDYEIECEVTTDQVAGFFVEHEGRNDVKVNPPGYQKGKIKLLNHLRAGDRVVLIKFSGGQRYQVIDRVGDV